RHGEPGRGPAVVQLLGDRDEAAQLLQGEHRSSVCIIRCRINVGPESFPVIRVTSSARPHSPAGGLAWPGGAPSHRRPRALRPRGPPMSASPSPPGTARPLDSAVGKVFRRVVPLFIVML